MMNLPNYLAAAAAASLFKGGKLLADKRKDEASLVEVELELLQAHLLEGQHKPTLADNERGHLA